METVILHYCYKVNQEDFNGRAMLLLSTLFFLFYNNACLQQADYAV